MLPAAAASLLNIEAAAAAVAAAAAADPANTNGAMDAAGKSAATITALLQQPLLDYIASGLRQPTPISHGSNETNTTTSRHRSSNEISIGNRNASGRHNAIGGKEAQLREAGSKQRMLDWAAVTGAAVLLRAQPPPHPQAQALLGALLPGEGWRLGAHDGGCGVGEAAQRLALAFAIVSSPLFSQVLHRWYHSSTSVIPGVYLPSRLCCPRWPDVFQTTLSLRFPSSFTRRKRFVDCKQMLQLSLQQKHSEIPSQAIRCEFHVEVTQVGLVPLQDERAAAVAQLATSAVGTLGHVFALQQQQPTAALLETWLLR